MNHRLSFMFCLVFLGIVMAAYQPAAAQSVPVDRITRSLSVGSRGPAVSQLQAFLGQIPGVYPEGLVTGYFGPLTRSAVMRLQSMNSLPPVGIVGPMTRSLIRSMAYEIPRTAPTAALPTTPQPVSTAPIASRPASGGGGGSVTAGGGGGGGGGSSPAPSPAPAAAYVAAPAGGGGGGGGGSAPIPSAQAQDTTPTPTPSFPTPTPPPPATTQTVCNTALLTYDGYDSSHMISRDACTLVNSLFSQGQAAGNAGDQYDNRDGLHVNFCEAWTPNPTCPIERRLFPQHDWIFSGSVGAPSGIHSGITIGQSSEAGWTDNGTVHNIPHVLYESQSKTDTLYRQYTHSNLYAYPALDDDRFAGSPTDPGALANPVSLNRVSLNLANTPYTIASRQIAFAGTASYYIHGASGSDIPFVKLSLLGLAALKPDVKLALQAGPVIDGDRISFLIPTLQMLLRHSHRSIASEADYLGSDSAHRSMYMAHYLAGNIPQPQYDSAKLVRIANALTVADVPPLVRIGAVSDGFSSAEKLFDTPGALARSVPAGVSRTISVSAGGSLDLDGQTGNHDFAWKILSGDPSHVTITTNLDDPSQATIEFRTDGLSPGDRLDVGIFVKKRGGTYWSVPGIVSAYVRP